jgi:hypothetical protein
MSKRKTTNTILIFLCCLLLTACGRENDPFHLLGLDLKTEFGIGYNPIETFEECIKKPQTISTTKLKELFDHEAEIVRKNRNTADWGNMACLAFNDLATASQVKEAALLLPDKYMSSEEEMVVDILRAILAKRAVTIGKLANLEQLLTDSLDLLDTLKSQVIKLQEIEELLETNDLRM